MKRRFSTVIILLSVLLWLFPPSGRTEEAIPVASIYAFTGPAAASNAPSCIGVRYAVEDVNRSGGVSGKPIRLLEFDTFGTPIGAKVAAEQAVKSGAAAIIGAAWSSQSLAIASVAQENRVPMISNISTHPDLTKIGDFIFRICYDDTSQGRFLSRFAREELNAETASLFVDLTSHYSLALSANFEKGFKKAGGRVVSHHYYKFRQETLVKTVADAAPYDPDLLFIPGYEESAFAIREAQRIGLRGIPLGGDGWGNPNFLVTDGNKTSERIEKGYYCTHWDEAVQTDRSKAFVRKYRKDEPLYPQEALAYDAVMLLVDALNRAASTNGEAIRRALISTRNFEGVTGVLHFDENGNPLKPIVMMKIENGRQTFLGSYPPESPSE